MQESGKSSKRARRRRMNRDLSRDYPPQPGSASGNLYPLQRSPGSTGQPGQPPYNGSSGLIPSNGQPSRSELSPPADARRTSRTHRSSARGGFNLRNLLSNDNGNGGRSRRETPVRLPNSNGSRNGNNPTALSPVRPMSAGTLSRPRGATVTPLVPQPSRTLRPVPTPVAPDRRSRSTRRASKPPSPLLYITRLLILGVGVGAIAGTVLHIWNPKDRAAPATSPSATPAEVQAASLVEVRRDTAPSNPNQPIRLQIGQPMSALSNTIQGLINQYQGFQVGVFVIDQDNGNSVDLRGGVALPAASTIKVPVLVAFLQDVEAGKIRPDEMLAIQQSDVAEGSGEFQYLPVGEQISALETATKMITVSDNTATNMIIRRLGGAEQLNQRFRSWGLTNTTIRNPLADLAGSNTTSARDLTTLLSGVAQGQLLSLRARDRLMHIMQGTVNDSLIPAGIEDQQAVVAHKTGNIDTLTGDTAIVDMPTGKRYVVTVLVQRPAGDERSQDLVRQISSVTYQYFQQSAASRSPAATGTIAPAGASPAAPTTPSNAPDVTGGTSPDSPGASPTTPGTSPAPSSDNTVPVSP